jgi:NAD(P)-dependent dehydrogenase (short-subunit alcohol dehydrogenase family)
MGLADAAAAGAKVTIASSDQSRLYAALAALPGGCNGVVVDARSESSVTEALAGIGELDHLVYTAGDSLAPRPLGVVSLDEGRRLSGVRFWAVTAVRPRRPRIRAGGSVVLTSGTVAVRPSAGAAFMAGGAVLVAGGATAIEGLTRGLAVELALVRVNAVRPGAVHTPIGTRLLNRSVRRCSAV